MIDAMKKCVRPSFVVLATALLGAGMWLCTPHHSTARDAHETAEGQPATESEGADGDDLDFALEAVRQGKAMPLTKLQDIVTSRYKGEIIGVEVTREHKELLYEMKILRPGGKLTEVEINAMTGRIEEVEND